MKYMRAWLVIIAGLICLPAAAQNIIPAPGCAPTGCTMTGSLVLPAAIISGGTSPTIAAGSGAGTSPSISVSGAENSQAISLTTTCTIVCSGSAVIATISLPLSCSTQATPTITPANINAAQLSGSGSVYIGAPSVNSYTINSSSTGLAASTLYKWNVHVDCW